MLIRLNGLTWEPPDENWMIIGASFFLAASRQALIPDEETQFTAGIAYPNTRKEEMTKRRNQAMTKTKCHY